MRRSEAVPQNEQTDHTVITASSGCPSKGGLKHTCLLHPKQQWDSSPGMNGLERPCPAKSPRPWLHLGLISSSQELFLVTVLPTLLPFLWKLMRYGVQSSESISKEIFNLDVRSWFYYKLLGFGGRKSESFEGNCHCSYLTPLRGLIRAWPWSNHCLTQALTQNTLRAGRDSYVTGSEEPSSEKTGCRDTSPATQGPCP